MSARIELWTPSGSQLLRRGRIPIGSRSDLIVGTYKPSAATTGVLPGIALTPVSGNVTLSTPGEVYQNKDVFGRLSIAAADVTVRNCRIRGGTTPSTGLITCTNAAVQRAVIEDCEIRPDTPAYLWNGVVGHDYTLRRCNIHHVTDCVDVHNTSATLPYQTGVVIEACWLHDLAWWTASKGGVVHTTDTETHNDLIQITGGKGMIVRGNNLDARFARQYGHWIVGGPGGTSFSSAAAVDASPDSTIFTTVALGSLSDGGPYQPIPERGTGTRSSGRYNWDDLSALMLNSQLDPAIDMVIEKNWITGGNYAINGGGNPNPGGGANLGRIAGNRFSRDQGDQMSGGNTTATITLYAGWTTGTTDIPRTGADANVYDDDNSPVMVRL